MPVIKIFSAFYTNLINVMVFTGKHPKLKKHLITIIMLLFVLSQHVISYAQEAGEELTLSVNDYSLIETNYAPVSLNFASPQPGKPVAAVSNSDLYVKLSSIVPGGTHRKMTVQMTSGSVPEGTVLTCIAAECTTTNSGGELGIPVDIPIILSGIDQDLVNQIGTCYTGTGNEDGYQITFTWRPDAPANYHLLKASNTDITVVFTISAHDGNN